MKRRPLCTVEPVVPPETPGEDARSLSFDEHHPWILHVQTAMLLALLEGGQLAKWQFDICTEALENRSVATKSAARRGRRRL